LTAKRSSCPSALVCRGAPEPPVPMPALLIRMSSRPLLDSFGKAAHLGQSGEIRRQEFRRAAVFLDLGDEDVW
jgi:hypothetical protein